MSRRPGHPFKAVLPAALGFGVVLGGCRRSLPPAEFLKAYHEEYASEVQRGEYTFTIIPLTDEYLAARTASAFSDANSAPGIPAGSSDPSEAPSKGLRISLRIELSRPTGGPDDQRKDLLNGAMLNGPGAFAKRRRFLENEVSTLASLECGDRRFRPAAYRFSPGIGFPAVHGFLFLFSPEKDIGDFGAAGCRFSLKDIGIGTGTVEARLREQGNLTLRIRK